MLDHPYPADRRGGHHHDIDEDQLRLRESEPGGDAPQGQVAHHDEEQDEDRPALQRLHGPVERLDDLVAVDAKESRERDQQRPDQWRAPGRWPPARDQRRRRFGGTPARRGRR